ncbi:1-phosphatidylinositol 4,5-bisphosphate phosphodiesterase beta-1-like isoform X2 [Dendronephthya gigantea]|uniref:1-phosphatidylinositol 4,5-bisphosphate phosphodiesterase beta-1-like isoform X2 n=1 Tax=Dendronephthya gigantea TaxID=151771 RepID=UPI0010695144|nr:1-phosphatidylinositol 4,5-bisphosphate phosphodiesterase beta-1-like isoform X2 [Dendronephthya gigantea]
MASGGVYAETLELPKVPDSIISGSSFIKWDDDSGLAQTCTLKIDSNGYVLFWKFEEKAETDLLDVIQINDVRTGKYARMPKDSKVKELIKSKLSSSENLEDHCITVLYGPNFVETNAVNFVASSVEDAKLWFDCLMSFCQHVLPANASPLNFLEKHYTKLMVQANPDGSIPVKLITKYLASAKDDKKKVYDTLQSLGLASRKDDAIQISDFTLDTFLLFMSRICNRQDIDKIFTEIGAKKKPYLTVDQFVVFLNQYQRDPRLNEILFPYYDTERAMNLISTYEPNKQFSAKGHLSVQGFTRYLMSEHNTVINSDRLALHQDMNAPLSHYFINSSHNTYLTGHQLTGKSSVEIYRQALMSGCRCIELDCWDGKSEDQEPCITHGMTLCTEVSFKDVIEAIAESAFKTSDYPVILSFENHCSRLQQRKMAQYCVSIFGDMLLDKPIDDFPLDDGKPLPSPKALSRKIIIKNKKKLPKAANSESASGQDGATSNGNEATTSDVTDGETTQNGAPAVDELSESIKSDGGENLKDVLEKNKEKKDEEDEVESENVLSDLVNYIQPVHFKSFDYAETRNKSYEMTSFVETVATTLLKQEPVEFVNYNKRQLSRIYPKGTRVGSENYMPQVFWNAGCQLVALNFQTLDVPMMLNLGKFEYNGKCGYIRKPDFMCRTDRSFDPFAESTVDGIIAGAVEVKVISGQFLSERKVGTYVEVDMYGLPADTVRRKHRTKTVTSNGMNPVYDDEPFRFNKVVLPNLAVLRLAVYEESGKLIGNRVLPVDSIQPGYRHIKLKSDCNQALCLPVLFVYIVTTDYVPSGFSDFADALTNPIAFQSKADQRGHMLESLMDEEEASSQVPELQPKLAPASVPANARRASSQFPGPTSKSVKQSMSVGNLGNGAPLPSNRSVSLTADHIERKENSSRKFKRSQSTKKREEPKIVPVPIQELRDHKNLQKLKEKHRKDMTLLVRKHMKEKDRVQKQHFTTQEKLAKDMDKEVESTKKKLDKTLKRATKSGKYEEIYKEGVQEVSSLRKDHEMRMNVLKLDQREEVITLIEKQLKEQHDFAKESIDPEFQELRSVMDITKTKQSKKLAEVHVRKINDLKKSQDLLNSTELKLVSKERKSKDEIQRLKREQNKRHIEQAVKERQKANEFHDKEMQQLKESHDQLLEQLEDVKEKSVLELKQLYEKRCRQIRNADLEVHYATLYAEEQEESKL